MIGEIITILLLENLVRSYRASFIEFYFSHKIDYIHRKCKTVNTESMQHLSKPQAEKNNNLHRIF